MDKAGNKESLPEVSGVKVSETNRETVVISSKDGEEYVLSIHALDSLLKQESGYIEIHRRSGGYKSKTRSDINNPGSLSINNGQVILSSNGDSYPISSIEQIATLIPNRAESANPKPVDPRPQDKPGITPDEDQKSVIDADPDARILVDAGPGTGKTYVACARVAALLNSGKVQGPESIWIISFTRAAVQEIRERIDKFLDEDKKGCVPRIKTVTLDSLGWEFHSGATAKDREDTLEKKLLNYDDTIEKAIQLVREDVELEEWIQDVEHLVVDEAQDILCRRAEFVMRIIEKLDDNCGVTVFADEAQAIYGFSTKNEPEYGGNWKCTLPTLIRVPSKVGIKFRRPFSKERYELRTVHRTSKKNSPRTLMELYTDTRKEVIAGEINYLDLYKKLQHINKLEPAGAGCRNNSKPYKSRGLYLPGNETLRRDSVDKEMEKRAKKRTMGIASFVNRISFLKKNYQNDVKDYFILFRSQEDALRASSCLECIPHRVRLQNLPQCIHPWVGATLWNYTKNELSKDEFQNIWRESVDKYGVDNCCFAGKTWDQAWETLYALAGESSGESKDDTVDVEYLREVLGRKRPPVTISTTEIGYNGPLVGTIHTAKGREVDGVALYINEKEFSDDKKEEEYEESRVLFVGASRAKKWLGVGKSFQPRWDAQPQKLDETQRIYALDTVDRETRKIKYRAQVEIGLAQDITPESVVGKTFFENQDTVECNQKELITKYAGNIRLTWAGNEVVKNNRDRDNICYAIYEGSPREDNSCGDKHPLAYFSKSVNQDLISIRNDLTRKLDRNLPLLPYEIDHLRILGIRTLVVRPGDRTLEKLHEPWRSSGIMLAPVVFNYAWAHWRWRV